ncbi:MAG: hypothetical protein AAGE52_26735 [Myxococcota bacterium]
MRPFLILLLSAGCAAPIAGTELGEVPQPGAAVARATTSEPGGVRVLLHGQVSRHAREGAWLATRPRELRRLWSQIGASGSPPAVDFDRFVVFGAAYMGGVCQSEITGVNIDAEGQLSLAREPLHGACIALATWVGQVFAVPRRILPEEIVWAARHRPPWIRRFRLASGNEEAGVSSEAPSSFPNDVPFNALGEVSLPPAGTISLRALGDRAFWVAHHRDGAIAVLATERERSDGTLAPVVWTEAYHRFETEHDSLGRSVHGLDPLIRHLVRRVGERVAIGPIHPVPEGPITSRSTAPELEGSAVPYLDHPLVPLDGIPEGEIVRVDASLVFGREGPPRVCVVPEGTHLPSYRGCSAESYALARGASETRNSVGIRHGPLVVRRSGDALDFVLVGATPRSQL